MTDNDIRSVAIGDTITVIAAGRLISGPYGGTDNDTGTHRVGDWRVWALDVSAWAPGEATLGRTPEVKVTLAGMPVDFDWTRLREAIARGTGTRLRKTYPAGTPLEKTGDTP